MSHTFRRSLLPAMAALALAASSRGQSVRNTGAFVDRANKQHLWTVDAVSHALIWDGAPFMPVGGLFSPHYLAEGATEENWNKDAAALAKLKEKGVLDLIVNPVVSAVDVPAANWQKLIDHLDAQGFRYGVAFGAGITTPARGWVVKPTNYRVEDIRENVDVSWSVSDADNGYFVFVEGQDTSHIPQEGQIRVSDGLATVPGRAGVLNGTIGIFYPHKTIKPTREAALPDVWGSFDRYRDRLLATLGQVKFGPGLRFFLDPLARPLGIRGESDNLIPDTPGFRMEWEAYLTQHYPTIDDLMNAWGLNDRNIADFKQAARMIPLYSDTRGVPYMLDTETGKRMEAKGSERFWSDLRDCRNESIAYYMNVAADVLKREIADVPVVYTRTHHHRIFTQKQVVGGFDGLGIAAYGRGSAIVTNGADSVYSQVSEAAHPTWCLVTEMMDTASPAKPQPGYASLEALKYDVDWLKNIGAKGYYLNGFQVLPVDANPNLQLANVPQQLDWLRDLNARLSGTISAQTRPLILPFPEAAAGFVPAGPIGRGSVWWAPSLASGKALNFGSSYAGYTISLPAQEGGDKTVLWSLKGQRVTHLLVADPRAKQITTADGQPLVFKPDLKKKTITITMDENPIVINGADPEILPLEAVQDVFAELNALVDQAESQKIGGSHYKLAADRAQSNFKHGDYKMSFIQAVEVLNGIVNLLQPYSWIEAERPDSHTFSEVTAAPAASGGAFLSLSSETRPGSSGYGATYKFNVPANDTYSLWISGTPLSANASPFAWIVDQGAPHSSGDATPIGASYMSNQFGWLNLGRVPLQAGPHTLTLRVTDVAVGANKYSLSLDAILVTRGAFTPNGITRPTLVSDDELKGRAQAPKKTKQPAKGAK